MGTAAEPLTDLLGETRAQLIDLLRAAPRSVADLADALGLSEAAIRRHLRMLEHEALVEPRVVRRVGRGRPSARYHLTAKAYRLFPDRSAELANDLISFLSDEHGKVGVVQFLQWRQRRQQARYAAALADVSDDDLRARTERLAALLSEDGFLASVHVDDDGGLQLIQGHCAIKAVAAEHRELCAFEAALFRELLGTPVARHETIARGASACICRVKPSSVRKQRRTARGARNDEDSR